MDGLESEKYFFFTLGKALVKFPYPAWRMGICNGRGSFLYVSLGLSLPFSWHGCEENFLVLHQENLVRFLEVKVMKCEAFLNLSFAGGSHPHATSHSTPKKSYGFKQTGFRYDSLDSLAILPPNFERRVCLQIQLSDGFRKMHRFSSCPTFSGFRLKW